MSPPRWKIELVESFVVFVGVIDEIILEGRTLVKVCAEEYIKSSDFINGLETHVVEIHEHFPVEQSQVFGNNLALHACDKKMSSIMDSKGIHAFSLLSKRLFASVLFSL